MANIWISLVLFPVLAVIAGSHLYTVYTYRRFSDHLTGCGLTGAQVARLLLDKVGLSQVKVREVQGLLVDGYDVTSSTIRLSSENFHSTWVAAAGIAAHEVGRVLQAYYTDQHPGFTLLNPRMAIFFNPAGKLGAVLAGMMLFVGLLSQWQAMTSFGVIILLWAVGCSWLTLPIEVNASRKAMGLHRLETVLQEDESVEARKVLHAAAWAYVSTAGTALVQILRDVIQRDRD